MDERLLTEFLAEAEDAVEALYADLSELRHAADGRARREALARVFRRVHTLKGSAASAGLAGVAALAHDFESLLEAVRAGRARLDARVLEAFDTALAALEETLAAAGRGEDAPPPRDLVEALRRLALEGGESDARDDAGRELDASGETKELSGGMSAYLDEQERRRLREAVAEGARSCVVSVSFSLADFDARFRQLSDALNEAGEVVSTLPVTDADAPERVGFRVVYATRETRAQTLERIAPFGATVEESTNASGAGDDVAPADEDDAPSVHTPRAGASAVVRVALDELDELISSAHAVFGEALAALDDARERGADSQSEVDSDERAARVRRRFFEIEEQLIALRMTPARRTLERAARAGSSAARAEGREVDFEIVGGEVRLDRSVAELVADPLLHLVRNAVVHGVEPPEERRAAGKGERGRVRVEASGGGGRVRLRVSDDGRGVDPETIASAARERGLVGESERMTEERALRLIFRPGFSTAREVSSTSGRGVGLDVVERSVEDAGGEVRVRSRRGEGSTFELNLPARLALTRAVYVRSGGRVYCVDASHALDIRTASRARIERREGVEFIRLGGDVLRLVRLRALLGQPVADEGEETEGVAPGESGITVLVSPIAARAAAEEGEGTGERIAVLVDGVEGRGEILVRGLGRHAGRWRGIGGATELRDGLVALVLDLPRLVELKDEG